MTTEKRDETHPIHVTLTPKFKDFVKGNSRLHLLHGSAVVVEPAQCLKVLSAKAVPSNPAGQSTSPSEENDFTVKRFFATRSSMPMQLVPRRFVAARRSMILSSVVLGFTLCAQQIANAQKLYDASLGTLPQAQGFIYSGDSNVNGTNASPFISGGALQENTTVGAQYWIIPVDSSLDFSQHAVLEANLHIISSNYVPNVGTGTREGYYLSLKESTGAYTIGLAATGFNINTVEVPNYPLTPYPFPITDTFHIYKLVVSQRRASVFIDGVLVAGNIAPGNPNAVNSWFGGVAGASRSVTELKSFCYSTGSAETCAPSPCSALTITALSAAPNALWPPNHKMVSVNVSDSSSGGCGAISCKITAVSSNEPVDADGDWVITGNLTLNLRAERNGLGTGRVYTITVQCTDGSGNSANKTVVVNVSHDQGH